LNVFVFLLCRCSQAVALEGQWAHVWCLLLVDAVVNELFVWSIMYFFTPCVPQFTAWVGLCCSFIYKISVHAHMEGTFLNKTAV